LPICISNPHPRFPLLPTVLCVAFRPDGGEVAVSSLNAQISFWDPQLAKQVGSIEGRHDVGYSRKEQEKITAKKSAFGKYVFLYNLLHLVTHETGTFISQRVSMVHKKTISLTSPYILSLLKC